MANVDQFQYLMYRPLYWFGVGTAFKLNTSLSVATAPVYSNGDTTVTVNLKNWKWSDGETVSAADVLFFMNIYHAEPTNFCGYVKGLFPDDVTNVTASGQTVTFTLKSSVNSYWFTFNEMSQITPLPVAWDVTAAGQAAGSGGCSSAAYGTDDTGCDAVYTYLSNAAGFNPNNPSAANNSLATYATNPLWQTVDGPWTLSAFNPDGEASFVPNPKYSGPVKPTISKFTELPYTTDSSEFDALAGSNLTIGYLPYQDVTGVAPAPPGAGPNNSRLTNFNITPQYLWGIDYFPYNFDSTCLLYTSSTERSGLRSRVPMLRGRHPPWRGRGSCPMTRTTVRQASATQGLPPRSAASALRPTGPRSTPSSLERAPPWSRGRAWTRRGPRRPPGRAAGCGCRRP